MTHFRRFHFTNPNKSSAAVLESSGGWSWDSPAGLVAGETLRVERASFVRPYQPRSKSWQESQPHRRTSPELDERIGEPEADKLTLTVERDTARIETKRATRDLKAIQDALSRSQRNISELQAAP